MVDGRHYGIVTNEPSCDCCQMSPKSHSRHPLPTRPAAVVQRVWLQVVSPSETHKLVSAYPDWIDSVR